MCGRFTLTNPDPEKLKSTFGLPASTEVPMTAFMARYNIAPSQWITAVTQPPEGERTLKQMRWGLIPSWSKDPTIANKLINARGETAADKPSFRSALAKRRCLIPADGFYEWQSHKDEYGKVHKIPMYITLRDHGLFGIAGLFEYWSDPASAETIVTCTIMTGGPNLLMEPIHDRMPVIIPPDLYADWLDPKLTDSRLVTNFLTPFPAEQMAAYPVSTLVNNVRMDDPALILPASA
jgi:putative SOS response-associated peptidase YedK